MNSEEIQNQRRQQALSVIEEQELKALERANQLAELNKQRENEIASKETYRQSVKRASDLVFQEKVSEAQTKLDKKLEMSSRAVSQKESEVYSKRQSNLLRSEERKENVSRVQNVKSYQRDKLQERIDLDSEKVGVIREERDAIKDEKAAFKAEMDKMKKEISEKFELVRLGKVYS